VAAKLGTIFVEMDIDRDRWAGAQRKLLKDATSTSLRIEDNFRKLGIKSSAEMDLMRMKITNSFNMIKNSSQATANDIVRAEKAKNEQIKQLHDQQFGHQESMLTKLKKNWVAASAAIIAAWYAISRAVKAVGSVIMESARYETLGIVMETIGHNAGYSAAQMHAFAKGLESTGISMTEARQSLSRMNQAQLDLSKSTQLARVAQDAAVIGMMNSSDAFNQLVYGIQSANVRVLRTIGINVSFEDSYKKVAKQLGVTTTSFTELEKANIRMNAALEAGEVIAGTYEAAMETAGKQSLSLTRYFDNLKVLLGTAFLPAFSEIILIITGGIKNINENLEKNLEKAKDWGVGFRLVLIDIQAEFMRFAMFIDKVGETLTWAKMLLYGPGAALGIESSTKRFEAAAKANMEYEARYLKTEKELQELANRYVSLEASITPVGKAKAAAQKEADEIKRLAEVARNKKSIISEPSADLLKAEGEAEKQSAIALESLQKYTKLELFLANEKENALIAMRRTRLETDTGMNNANLILNQGFHDQVLALEILMQDERISLLLEFNDKYNALGKTQYDLERENIRNASKTYLDAFRDDAEKKIQIAEWTAAKLKAVTMAENTARLESFQQAAGKIANTFLQIAQAGGKQSKKAFKMYQGFAMVEAGIGTALAITKTLGQLGVWGIPLAIAIGAMGAVQIGMIASAKPPSYDQGTVTTGKGVYQTGNISEAHIPLKSGKVPVRVSGGGGTQNIQYIDMTGSTFLDQDTMMQAMNNIAAINVRKYATQVVINDWNNDHPIRSMIRGGR